MHASWLHTGGGREGRARNAARSPRPRARALSAAAVPLIVLLSFACGYSYSNSRNAQLRQQGGPAVERLLPVPLKAGSMRRMGRSAAASDSAGVARAGSTQKGRQQATQCYTSASAAAEAVAVRGTVILTVMNEAMLDFGRSWLAHLRAAGASNILVGVYDAATAAEVTRLGAACLDMGGLIKINAKEGFGWGSPNWRKTSWSRCFIIPEIMRTGFHVVWSDIDVVWFRDPTGMLPLHPEVDMIMGSDHLATTLPPGDTGFEDPAFAFMHQFNAGVTFLRNARNMIDLMDAWKVEMNAGRQKMNQDALNKELLRPGMHERNISKYLAPDNSRVLLAHRGEVRLGVLPVQTLMTGRTYTLQRLHKALGVEPWSVHLTWVWGRQPGKRARLQEAGLWRGEPPGSGHWGGDGTNFLAVDLVQPQIPFNEKGAPLGDWVGMQPLMEAYHVAAVEFQLHQVWYGMNLAMALNRTFIFPKMACFIDHNWWKAVDGRSSGYKGTRLKDFPLPFACPLDFLFEPAHLDAEFFGRSGKKLPPNATWAGRPLPYRVHSFLDDQELHPDVRASQLRLRTSTDLRCDDCKSMPEPKVCKAGPRPQGAGNSGTSTRSADGKVQPLETRCMAPDLDSGRLAAALAPLKKVRVLHIGDAPHAWGGWTDKAVGDDIQKRMDVAVFHWMGRSDMAARQLARNTTEPYFWRPFANVTVDYDSVVQADGAINMARALAARPRPWLMLPNQHVVFKGAQVPASLWS